ncbi:MAG: PHP domain-containing protein, partial [Clostridia bacterium]|nr:PHP domain-containing protein [Clostridia bacterium]
MTTPLPNLLRGFTPKEHLAALYRAIHVRAIGGDRKTGSIVIEAELDSLCDRALLGELEVACAAHFGVNSFRIKVTYPAELLTADYLTALCQRIKKLYPSANGFLDGAKCTFSEDRRKLTVLLREGGADFLNNAGCNREMEKILAEEFGLRTLVTFGGMTDFSYEEASQRAEEARQEAASSIPQAVSSPAPAPKKASEKQEKKSEFRRPMKKSIKIEKEEDLIMGKPYEEEILKIRDLNIDLGFVTVEGEIFAVNHREFESRDLHIISFDITDQTSSLRVSRPMSKAEAEPIVKALKVGDNVLVQGQLIYNNFEHEMTMNPKNIMRRPKTERKDTADEKRVELHLHTAMSSMDGITDVQVLVKRAAKWGHKAVA